MGGRRIVNVWYATPCDAPIGQRHLCGYHRQGFSTNHLGININKHSRSSGLDLKKQHHVFSLVSASIVLGEVLHVTCGILPLSLYFLGCGVSAVILSGL